jgi:hypothetical protein
LILHHSEENSVVSKTIREWKKKDH